MTAVRRERFWLTQNGRLEWHVTLSVENACWVDFAIFRVCYIDSKGLPQFLPKGWERSPSDARPWSEDSESVVSGHVKWDGCSEFEASDHVCYGAQSYAEIFCVLQRALELAHQKMAEAGTGLLWSPIDTAQMMAELGLQERKDE